MATTSTVNRVEPRVRPGISETMLNKVPEVTLHFWVVKVLCTTVGETAADFLNADGLPVLFRRLSEGSAHDPGHGETPPPCSVASTLGGGVPRLHFRPSR